MTPVCEFFSCQNKIVFELLIHVRDNLLFSFYFIKRSIEKLKIFYDAYTKTIYFRKAY